MKKLLVAIAVLLLATSAIAQEALAVPAEPLFKLGLELAAGGGFDLGEENQSFSTKSFYAAVHANAVEFDLFDATSGLGLELYFDGPGTTRYSLWSLNRANIPGVKGAYGGADVKVADNGNGGEGFQANLDTRIVTGYRFGKAGPGDIRIEFYAIEEDNPLRVAFLYGWK